MGVTLENQDRARDANFSKAMHGSTSKAGAFSAMFNKDKAAHGAAVDEYFSFWDGKGAGQETEADMAVIIPFLCVIKSLESDM